MDRIIEKKKWTPKKIAKYGIPSLFFLIILFIIIFGDKSSRLNVDLEKLTISEVTYGPFQEYIAVSGTVWPFETYYLTSSEGGMVESRIIESGTPVKKGDHIVRLTNTNLLLTILNNEAQVNRASNDLRMARLSMEQNTLNLKNQITDLDYQIGLQQRAYERAKLLIEKSLIAQEEFELARDLYFYSVKKRALIIESQKQDSLFRVNQIESLENSLEQMKTNLDIVRQKQENLTIKAPISGVLTSLDAEIGDTKSPGQRIGQIDVLDNFKVRAAIDEHYIARVEKGKKGSFEFAGENYHLIIDKIFLEVKEGRFEVDLIFEEEQPQGIRRGQTQHIRLELGDLEEAVLLPRGGFYQKTGGQWVYVVDPSGNFAVKRTIKLGRQNPRVFTVLEGLESGEKVITSSYDTFGDNDKLILKD